MRQNLLFAVSLLLLGTLPSFSAECVPPYDSLRCLRSFQRVEIKALAESSAQIAQCPVAPWAELGLCLDNATRRQ